MDKLAVYFSQLIADKRATPADDLMTALIAARDEGEGRVEDRQGVGGGGHGLRISECGMRIAE